MKVGDVYRTKISAANVVVLAPANMEGLVKVRLTIQGQNGSSYMHDEFLYPFELEPVVDSIQREFEEMTLRNKLMADYLKAQEQEEPKLRPAGAIQ